MGMSGHTHTAATSPAPGLQHFLRCLTTTLQQPDHCPPSPPPLQVAKQVVDDAILLCGPGASYSAIGNSISATAARHGYGIVRHFVGHGVGPVFHSHPIIYPYANTLSGRMVEGETFTIEPILTLGHGAVREWPDGWTSVTVDRSIAAQFEHAVLVTSTGVEVLTQYE